MWDQGGDDHVGGGFMDAPSQTPGGSAGSKRPQRAQNVVPVNIETVLAHSGETFKVCGQEVGMVVLVGQVRSVNSQATKSIYLVEDSTGSLEAIHWVEDGQERTSTTVAENMHVRVVGNVRVQQEKKHVMVYNISQLEDENEIQAHELEVKYAELKIRQMQEKENMAIGGNSTAATSGLSNSMMTGYGASAGAGGASGSGNYGNAKQNTVYHMIAACSREEGLGRDELLQQLQGKMGKSDIEAALDYLSSEGHVYSTIDDDHFKAMDG